MPIIFIREADELTYRFSIGAEPTYLKPHEEKFFVDGGWAEWTTEQPYTGNRMRCSWLGKPSAVKAGEGAQILVSTQVAAHTDKNGLWESNGTEWCRRALLPLAQVTAMGAGGVAAVNAAGQVVNKAGSPVSGDRVSGYAAPSTMEYAPTRLLPNLNTGAGTITPGPTVAADRVAELASLRAALPRVYNLRTDAATTGKYLRVAGGDIVAAWFGSAARSTAYINAGTPMLFEDGIWETATDADDFAVLVFGQQAATMQFLVDGELLSATDYTTTVPVPGSNREMWFRFQLSGGRRARTLEFHNPVGCRLYEIIMPQTCSLWKPAKRPQFKIVGDSFTDKRAGPGEPMQSSSYAIARLGAKIARIIGWGVPAMSCSGGSGFSVALANNYNYGDRLANEVADPQIDIVILWGSGNDIGTAEAQYRADVARAINNAKAKYPNARLVVTGIQGAFWAENAAFISMTTWLRETALANGCRYIPVAAHETGDDGILWGSGSVQSPAGTGNADVYLGYAGAGPDRHPNIAGIDHLARRIALALRAAIA